MLNIATYADVCLTTVKLAPKRRISQRSYELVAGPSTFTHRSIDTVPDIKSICFFCEKDAIGSDRNAMTKHLYEDLLIVLCY